MDDRTLLMRAAKAAGIELHVWGSEDALNYAAMNLPGHPRWNSITNSADALELAVKLHMFDSGRRLMAMRLEETRLNPARSDLEIFRRAITRCAAAATGEET